MSTVSAHFADQVPECKSLEEAQALIAQLHNELRISKLQIEKLLLDLYGRKSEKMNWDDAQLQLLADSAFPTPLPATFEVLLSEDEKELLGGKRSPEVKRHPVRQPAPEHLSVEEVRIEVAAEEKQCECCGRERSQIGEDVSEEIEFIPARFVRRRYVRPKLACSHCRNKVVQAPAPPRLIEKGKPGPGLLAHVVLSKYMDHLPLYRQEQIALRSGVHLPRQTLVGWIEQAAFSLQPVYEAMKQELFCGDFLQVDETPVKVLDPDQPGKAAQAYLWVYARPGDNVLFEYADGRSHAVPKAMLEGFSGTIQADGYSAYETLMKGREDLKRIGCWAHVRRKFVDAAGDDKAKALWFLREIRELYAIEAEARQQGLAPPERLQLRQLKAPPILERIKARLDELAPTVLPKSPLGKAIRYALNEWPALLPYVHDGQFEIDNNLCENAIRPAALGRKNWLFIGHPQAGWRSAVIYSLALSCKRHGINPSAYFTDLFRTLPTATNHSVHQLTPKRWKDAHS